jgi:hypothetical protein
VKRYPNDRKLSGGKFSYACWKETSERARIDQCRFLLFMTQEVGLKIDKEESSHDELREYDAGIAGFPNVIKIYVRRQTFILKEVFKG